MVVELTAARIIAPILGSSVYTWTSVIGVVLLGTSIGNVLGGKIVDRIRTFCVGGMFFWLSSVTVLLIPLSTIFVKNVAFIQVPLWLSVLIAATLLFLVPSMFLGAIYPAMFKLYLQSFSTIGKEAGSVSASWALGSIFGTFLTGFVFIGYLGSNTTLFIVSVILFICGLWLLPLNKFSTITAFLYVAVFLLLFLIQNQRLENPSVIFDKESNYYSVKVADKYDGFQGNTRILFLDVDSHSIENMDGSVRENYTNFYPVFSVLNDAKTKDIAVIGGGSLGISENFKRYYPEAAVLTAEIDPVVTEIAEKYFNTSPYIIENTIPTDGRLFLLRSDKKFDIIFSDAYSSFISVPWHLTTKEFFQTVRGRLNPGGSFAINFISAKTGNESALYDSFVATFSSVFESFYVFTYGKSSEELQNIVLIGMNSQKKFSGDEMRERLLNLPNGSALERHFDENVSIKDDAIVLTDDFAPTDRLLLPAINSYSSDYFKFFQFAI